MSEHRDYSQAMRARRRALLLAVVWVVALFGLLYATARPDDSVPLAVSVLAVLSMIGMAVIGYRSLMCPACGERLGSLADKVCRACGAGLTDTPISTPPVGGPPPEVRAYMQRSEYILQRWLAIRRTLRPAPWIAGFAAATAFWLLMHAKDPTRYSLDDAFVAAFIGLCVAALAWLVLVHVADQFFSILFAVCRGRCPICHAWFTQRIIALPGAVVTEPTLPDFCPSCGERLR